MQSHLFACCPNPCYWKNVWFSVRICLTTHWILSDEGFQVICLFFSCRTQNTHCNGSGSNKLFRVQCHIIWSDPRDNIAISLSWPHKNRINLVKHINDILPKADLFQFCNASTAIFNCFISAFSEWSATPLHTRKGLKKVVLFEIFHY